MCKPVKQGRINLTMNRCVTVVNPDKSALFSFVPIRVYPCPSVFNSIVPADRNIRILKLPEILARWKIHNP
jgi:hypothetical protein